MKISFKDYSNIFVLISSILFLILGSVMYTRPDAIVIITTYIFGGLLILVGLFKCIKNYLDVKRDNNTSSSDMIIGIIMCVFGVICIFLAGVVEAVVRLIIGGWILLTGINRLINALYIDKKTSKFWISLILALFLLGGGLYTILEVNLAFKAIGIILIIYSFLEIIGYIFNKKTVTVLKTEVKEIKEEKKEKIQEAEIVETNNTNLKDLKKKRRKK